MIFLVCNNDGDVIEVIRASSFEKAYNDTIGCNHGEILVELDDKAIGNIQTILETRARANRSSSFYQKGSPTMSEKEESCKTVFATKKFTFEQMQILYYVFNKINNELTKSLLLSNQQSKTISHLAEKFQRILAGMKKDRVEVKLSLFGISFIKNIFYNILQLPDMTIVGIHSFEQDAIQSICEILGPPEDEYREALNKLNMLYSVATERFIESSKFNLYDWLSDEEADEFERLLVKTGQKEPD